MIRVRSRGTLIEGVHRFYNNFPVSCASRVISGNTDVVATDVFIGEKRTTIDYVTPNFKARIKNGEVVLNPFTSTYTVNGVSGSSDLLRISVADACVGPSIKAQTHNFGSVFVGYLRYFETPKVSTLLSPSKVQSLNDEAWTKAMADRRKGSANLVESLAEFDQSFALFGNPLSNAIRLVEDFRLHGKRRSGYKDVKAASKALIRFTSSEYLRFRYGIEPLMADIKACMKALETGWNRPSVLHRSRGNAVSQTSETVPLQLADSDIRMYYRRYRTHYHSAKATVYDTYRYNVFDELGLTFHNVVGVPFELTRYSFVVDWFANVGDLLYANIPRVNTTFHGGVIVTEDTMTSVWSPTGYDNLIASSWSLSGTLNDSLSYFQTIKDRVLRSDNGALVINNDFRFDNWKRVTDAAALLLQRLISIGF